MKEKLWRVSNWLLLGLLAMVMGTVQTSLWFQIFGHFPAPAFWIPCLIFVALFRPTLEAILMTYFICALLSPMTAMPDGIFMITALAVGFTAQLVKRRIYWASSTYFMIICGFGALVFHIYHWIFSFFLDDNPMSWPELTDWVIEALLTPLIAPFLYQTLWAIDRLTQREQPVEASSEVM